MVEVVLLKFRLGNKSTDQNCNWKGDKLESSLVNKSKEGKKKFT